MATRRQMVGGILGAGALAAGGLYLWHGRPGALYDARADALRVPFDAEGSAETVWNGFIRYATLAANSLNAQAWTFAWENEALRIAPDPTRRSPAIDPDDRLLYMSLGCALENLMQAGYTGHWQLIPRFENGGITVAQGSPIKPAVDWLFLAIPHRQSTRTEFDGSALSVEEMRLLQETPLGGGVEGVTLKLVSDDARKAIVRDAVVTANVGLMSDAAYAAELFRWTRFSRADAMQTNDGLFTGAAGGAVSDDGDAQPQLADFVAERINADRQRRLIDSASALLLIAAADEPAAWVEAGRAAERAQLAATAMGLATSYVGEPLLRPKDRAALNSAMGFTDSTIHIILRIGRAPKLPYSLRRPISDVYKA